MDHRPGARVTEFAPRFDAKAIGELRRRLKDSRPSPDLGTGWELGVPRRWLDGLLHQWRDWDVSALERRLASLDHRRAELDGRAVHLVLAQGQGPQPLPLILTHGWPGSFLEYLALLDRLTDPAAHGGDPADAFTVIVPSLPGYGFSDPPPPTGMTGREVARLWHRLMVDGLGHHRYVAHGSDLGAGVTGWMARDHPGSVLSIHLATPGLAPVAQNMTDAEGAFARDVQEWTAEEGGYMHEHATKPATLGAALSDSPAGLAAWIAEKISAWSSTRPDGSPDFDRALLLDILTLFWATDTITTSLLPYWAHRHFPGAALTPDDISPTPTAITTFGGERVPFPKPPRELAQRYYNVTTWTEHPTGGHFPAVSEPDLLATCLRNAFRAVREPAQYRT